MPRSNERSARPPTIKTAGSHARPPLRGGRWDSQLPIARTIDEATPHARRTGGARLRFRLHPSQTAVATRLFSALGRRQMFIRRSYGAEPEAEEATLRVLCTSAFLPKDGTLAYPAPAIRRTRPGASVVGSVALPGRHHGARRKVPLSSEPKAGDAARGRKIEQGKSGKPFADADGAAALQRRTEAADKTKGRAAPARPL